MREGSVVPVTFPLSYKMTPPDRGIRSVIRISFFESVTVSACASACTMLMTVLPKRSPILQTNVIFLFFTSFLR